MQNIYHFEDKNPPILNEEKLRQLELEKKTHRQTAFLAAAMILSVLAAFLLGLEAMPYYPAVSAAFFAYVLFTTLGSGAAAIWYSEKGRCFI